MTRYQHYYKGFTEEQFAADEYFQQWVLQADEECLRFWNSFLLTNPGHTELLSKARQLVEDLAANDYEMEPLSPQEKSNLKENIYRSLELPAPESWLAGESRVLSLGRNWFRWTAVAASAAVLTVAAWLLMKKSGPVAGDRGDGRQMVRSGAKEMKRIVLEDSSVVILNANSSLTYSNSFQEGAEREVQLEGNAFFSVKKTGKHTPFIVHAHSLSITVLGTELNVDARSEAAEVALTSGKVKVEQEGNKDAITFLKPGEKLRLDTAKQVFVTSKMNSDLYSAWTEGNWNFRQTTLEEITGLIREYYGVDIEFKNQSHRHLRINAVIAVSSLQKLIPVIAQTLQIKIELQNNRLIVQ